MERTVSDLWAEMLVQAGVRRLYGIIGDSLNPVMEALQRETKLQWVNVRHEESAAFAAGAEALLTGRLAVCCGSCGPGNLHLINGLYNAQRSGAPVLALAAHIPTAHIGTCYFQETDPTQLFRECSVYCEMVSSAAQAPAVLAAAMRAALSQRGVAVVVLPGDVAAAPATGTAPPLPPDTPPATLCPEGQPLHTMAELLNRSPRITFLCGAGCAGAKHELLALARRVQAPIAYTLCGKESMEGDNPFAIGMIGLIGWGAAPLAILDCDLLVMWGTDFPFTEFLPALTPVVQVDRDADALGRRVPLALGVHGDVREVARALLPLLDRDRGDDFLSAAHCRHGRSLAELETHLRSVNENKPLRPELITRLISDYAEPDAVFTIDTGSPVLWAARYLRAGGTRRLLGSFHHGSMACALAMALGAKAAQPSRQVIALCGDGGLSMLPGDMLTMRESHLAVKIFVYNNAALDFVAMEQELRGMAPAGTALGATDFAAIARSMGLSAERISKPDEALPAVKRWLAAPGPALLEACVQAQEPETPTPLTPPPVPLHRSPGLETVHRLLYHRRRLPR